MLLSQELEECIREKCRQQREDGEFGGEFFGRITTIPIIAEAVHDIFVLCVHRIASVVFPGWQAVTMTT